MARWRAFLILSFVLLVSEAAPAAAQPASAPKLPGWWIAIDEVGHKPLWDRGLMVTMEELLIVDERLNFENRVMGFFAVDPEFCSKGGPCSDAPLIATGRLALAGSTLSIEDRKATRDTLDHKDVDPAIRERAISSTAIWRL